MHQRKTDRSPTALSCDRHLQHIREVIDIALENNYGWKNAIDIRIFVTADM